MAKGPYGGCPARAQSSLGRHRRVYLRPRPLNGNKRHTNNAHLCMKPLVFFLNRVFLPGGTTSVELNSSNSLNVAWSYHKSSFRFIRAACYSFLTGTRGKVKGSVQVSCLFRGKCERDAPYLRKTKRSLTFHRARKDLNHTLNSTASLSGHYIILHYIIRGTAYKCEAGSTSLCKSRI